MWAGHVSRRFRLHPDGPQLRSVHGHRATRSVICKWPKVQSGHGLSFGHLGDFSDTGHPGRHVFPFDEGQRIQDSGWRKGSGRQRDDNRPHVQRHLHLLPISSRTRTQLSQTCHPAPLSPPLLPAPPHHWHFLRNHGLPSPAQVRLINWFPFCNRTDCSFPCSTSVQNIPGQATLTTTPSVRHRYPADASSTNKVKHESPLSAYSQISIWFNAVELAANCVWFFERFVPHLGVFSMYTYCSLGINLNFHSCKAPGIRKADRRSQLSPSVQVRLKGFCHCARRHRARRRTLEPRLF